MGSELPAFEREPVGLDILFVECPALLDSPVVGRSYPNRGVEERFECDFRVGPGSDVEMSDRPVGFDQVCYFLKERLNLLGVRVHVVEERVERLDAQPRFARFERSTLAGKSIEVAFDLTGKFGEITEIVNASVPLGIWVQLSGLNWCDGSPDGSGGRGIDHTKIRAPPWRRRMAFERRGHRRGDRNVTPASDVASFPAKPGAYRIGPVGIVDHEQVASVLFQIEEITSERV